MTQMKKWPAGAEEQRLAAIEENKYVEARLEKLKSCLKDAETLLIVEQAHRATVQSTSYLRKARAPEPKV